MLDLNQGRSAYQPNALLLGQTGSQKKWNIYDTIFHSYLTGDPLLVCVFDKRITATKLFFINL